VPKLFAIFGLLLGFAVRVVASQPNIVYILADDLGFGDLGCYGQRQIATPHIDGLARDGLRFTQHYAGNSVCTPSRSSLLTGLHPGHVRHRDNPTFVNSYGFLPGQPTFGDVLRSAGYATGIAGKWHVGDRADSKDMAHHHGFDFAYCVGYPYPEGKIEHWPSHVFINGVATLIPENQHGERGRYMDDLYTDVALRFIETNRSRPFTFFLSLQGVHAPLDAEVSPTYANRDWPKNEIIFASMAERVDENVGRVLDSLRRLGLAENTVVFFSSDNGAHREGGHNPAFFQSSGGLRGGKRDLYEGGVRVPLIVRWPGVVKSNTVTDHICAFWDILPTFSEIGGATTPKGLDGLSFTATLRGKAQPQHAFLYWETVEEGGKQAVRLGEWKGVRLNVSKDEAAPFKLFNLASDLKESRDVAAQHPDIVKRIEQIAAKAHVPSPMSALFPSERASVTPAAESKPNTVPFPVDAGRTKRD
jgi:arylsulfatase A